MFFILLMFTLCMLYVVHVTRNQLIEMLENGKPDDALRLLRLTITDIPGVTED